MIATSEDHGSPRARWLVQLHCERVLGTLVAECARVGVDILPVKGIVSARTLYSDVAERPLSDIDVRVRPADLGPLLALARVRGWRVLQRLHSYANAVIEIDGRAVDVETHVGTAGSTALSVGDLIARASRDRALFPFECLVPNPHDHALLLVLNAYKDHMAHALAWAIRDLACVVRAPWFDARELTRRADDARARTVLWIVAEWMAREQADARWGDVLATLGPAPRPAFAAAHRWLEPKGAREGLALRILSRFGSDSPARRALAVGRMAAFQAEAVLSRWSDRPYTRGVTVLPTPVRS